MSDEQTALSWLGLVGLFIAIWLVYKPTLTAIIFGPTQSSGSSSPLDPSTTVGPLGFSSPGHPFGLL